MTTERPLHSAPGKRAIDLNHYARADILRAFLTRQMPQFSTTCEIDVPIITLGKLIERGDTLSMPVAVQVHHGVIDGLHVGRFYAGLSRLSEQASDWL